MGAFHSTKTFENFESVANDTEISRKSFQKFRKLLNCRNANHSTENSRFSGSIVEWKQNFRENIFENLGIHRKVALFLKILENALPSASGSWVAENSNRTFWLNGMRLRSHSPACVSDRGRLGYTSPVFLCLYNPRWRRVKTWWSSWLWL